MILSQEKRNDYPLYINSLLFFWLFYNFSYLFDIVYKHYYFWGIHHFCNRNFLYYFSQFYFLWINSLFLCLYLLFLYFYLILYYFSKLNYIEFLVLFCFDLYLENFCYLWVYPYYLILFHLLYSILLLYLFSQVCDILLMIFLP